MSVHNQQSHLQIVRTADGSNTIYNALVGENYHSRNGALQESRYVFVTSGLEYFLEHADSPVTEVAILEVGFGTGLNFLLTAGFCTKQQLPLHYTGIEAYPLTNDMIAQTGYDQYVPTPIWTSFLATYTQALTAPAQLNEQCTYEVAACKLDGFESAGLYDVIYFDAFASKNQPEMWDEAAITHTLKYLKPGGVFVTYAITGNLKRIIKALGLQVQKAPGAPGKREMLRAIKGF